MIQNQQFKREIPKYDNETLWKMKHMSQELQKYRDFHRSQWDDSASKEMDTRFLEPHREDSMLMLDHLHQQIQALIQIDEESDQINRLSELIQDLDITIQEYLGLTREDLTRSSQTHEQFLTSTTIMESQMAAASANIRQANKKA